jgi:3-oxoacyl-[acyl-carrier protein] reductase
MWSLDRWVSAMELDGRLAVVTGAGGAIGSASVDRLVAAGARVLMVDRDASSMEPAAARHGGLAIPVTLDLADADAVRAAAEAMLSQNGRIDVLVNNAGILTATKLGGTSLDDWRRLMAVNVDAALLLTQAFVPAMQAAGWGRIINMSSYAWKSGGLTAGTAYSVSKAALVGLTFSAARELAGTGITVNAIAPAYVLTAMVMKQLTEAQRETQRLAIPVQRFCEPEEVAHAVGFLASPLAGFITGEVIDMNGGMHFD